VLSRQRAEAVMQALIDRGVDAARLSAEGLGEEKPIADNTTAQGRSQNRRVEIYLIGENLTNL
jgi:outer membrane protein OmpA-like peptidoglycan-associated protein